MTTISLNEDFESLLSGLSDTRLSNFTLDYLDLLNNFSPELGLLASDPTLSASGLTAVFRSLDDADMTKYPNFDTSERDLSGFRGVVL